MKCVIMSNRNIFISNLDKLTNHLICWVEKILNAAARSHHLLLRVFSVQFKRGIRWRGSKREKPGVLMVGQDKSFKKVEIERRGMWRISLGSLSFHWSWSGGTGPAGRRPRLMSLSTVALGQTSCVLWGLSIEDSRAITQAHHCCIVMAL